MDEIQTVYHVILVLLFYKKLDLFQKAFIHTCVSDLNPPDHVLWLNERKSDWYNIRTWVYKDR